MDARPASRNGQTRADFHRPDGTLIRRRVESSTAVRPVAPPRGGVRRSAGLRLAGIGPDTPDMPGGYIARDAAGRPTGWVQDAALELAQKVLPPMPAQALAGGLAQASARFAAHGIGTVRDPAVTAQEWHTYRTAEAAGQLAVRSHAMILTTPGIISAAGSVSAYLDSLEAQDIKPETSQGRLHLWGLKLVLDGGVEAAALSEPYADRPDFYGQLLWERQELPEVLTACVRRGWPVGIHAFGDRAIAMVLDTIHHLTERTGPLPSGTLVIEHGGLIPPAGHRAALSPTHKVSQGPLRHGDLLG